MSGFSADLEAQTLHNSDYRRVLYTGPHCQLVLMTLDPGQEIGLERHPHGDQFIRVEAGRGLALIDGEEHRLFDGAAVIIPAGAQHNVINTSLDEPLRLYTVYAPPEHAAGTVHRTKEQADFEESHPAHPH